MNIEIGADFGTILAVLTERIRRLAIAIHALQTILRLLEREGAQTRP